MTDRKAVRVQFPPPAPHLTHELARMEPSWHVLGPEPARFGPAP